jgi:hypothetical protein
VAFLNWRFGLTQMTAWRIGVGRSMGSTRTTKSDAGVKLGVPTSSRTSSAARVEFPIRLYLEESVFIHTPHPRSDRQDLGERQCSPRMRRLRW